MIEEENSLNISFFVMLFYFCYIHNVHKVLEIFDEVFFFCFDQYLTLVESRVLGHGKSDIYAKTITF